MIPARLLLVVGGVFLCLAARAWVLFLVAPERFQARTLIRINRVALDETTTNSAPVSPYFTQTEFEIMQSELVLDKAVMALDLNTRLAKTLRKPEPLRTSESRRQLKQSLELLPQAGGTNLVNIIVSWDDRELAAKVANGIADAYSEYRQDQWREIHSARTNAVQEQLAALDVKIQTAQQETWQLRTNLGPDDIEATNAAATTTFNSPQHIITLEIDNQAALIKEEHTLAALKKLDRKQLVNTLPTVTPDQIMVSLMEDLNASQLKLAGLQVDHGEQHPEVIRAKAAIANLNGKIEERAEGILKGMETHVVALKAVLQNAENQKAIEIKNAQSQAIKIRPYLDARRHLESLEQARETLRKNLELQPDAPKLRPVDIVDRAQPPLNPASRIPAAALLPTLLGAIFEMAGLLLLIRASQAKLRRLRHEA